MARVLRDGEGLPSFVEQEFREFLQCGALGGGFARFRCTGCGFDRLVPFSCHGGSFARVAVGGVWPSALPISSIRCPRCGGRLTLIALIDDPAVIGRMLQHLELPTEVPEARPARAPPALLLDGAPRSDAPDEFCVDDPA